MNKINLISSSLKHLEFVNPDETWEWLIPHEIILIQKKIGFRYSQDAIMLATFVLSLTPGQMILELGAGCGVISLLISHQWKKSNFHLVEIQESLANLALRNIQANQKTNQLVVEQSDINDPLAQFKKNKYDFVIMNPPYYPLNEFRLPKNASIQIAHHEVKVTFNQICETVHSCLKDGGLFCFSHLAAREAELKFVLEKNNLAIEKVNIHNDRLMVCAGKLMR